MNKTVFALGALLVLHSVLLSGALGSEEPGSGAHSSNASEPSEEEERECEEEEEELFTSDVHLARLEFVNPLSTLLLVTLFILLVILAKLVWHHRLMHFVSNNIPESCMLIVVGAHIGGLIIASFYSDRCNSDKDPPLRLTPDLFFLFLLPPIVLESGYFLDIRAFFGNITTILTYAFFGTLFNAFALGFTLYGLYQAGVLLVGLDVQFTLSSALLFGTICAAVDPVAVLAVFEEIHVEKLLHILVFGESLLNDAVTIVLFQVLGAFANRPFDHSRTDSSIQAEDALLAIAQFVVVVAASVLIGVLTGMVAAFITRFSEHVHVLEPIIVLTMGYLSYILADLFEFSGIVSLIFCALIMKHYVEANISRKSSITIKYTLKVISNVSEMVIFLFLGISLYDSSVQNWDTGLTLWTILFALIYRPIGVVVLTLILNIFRVRKIDLKSIFIMSYSGLRGAVAFSLALTRIFEGGGSPPESSSDEALKNEFLLRKSMVTAVTTLVLFTVFVQGISIKPLARLIKVRTADEHKPTMNEVLHGTSIDHVMSGVEDIMGHFGHNRVREKIIQFDSKYLRKIFERYPEARDEEILHTFKRLQQKESKHAAEQNLVFEYHKDEDGRVPSHISLRQDYEHVFEQSDQTQSDTEPEHPSEECIPSLNDVLAASFVHPHADHYGHVLATNDRDFGDAHHFEPINRQRDMLESKKRMRKAKRRRRQRLSMLRETLTLGASTSSLGAEESPRTEIVEPISDVAAIPLEDLAGYSTGPLFGPPLQREPRRSVQPIQVVLDSKETDV